jgi:GNAT superfamily N-acetyltransferase
MAAKAAANRTKVTRSGLNLTVRPLTPDLWPAFEDLFGKHGASNGCWCMYWRIGSQYGKRPREKNKAEFHAVVRKGPPPGLLAFDGELAVGWCQITPREDLPRISHSPFIRPIDDLPVWSISCFYIRRGYRRRGVTRVLVETAVDFARRSKAVAVEAYPVDVDHPQSSTNLYTGVAKSFAEAGFHVVGRRVAHRPIMRLELRTTRKRS